MRGLVSIKRMIVLGTLAAVVCFAAAGCAPQGGGEAPAQPDESQAGASQAAWSLSMECSTCHAAESATMSESGKGACAHADEAAATCATCHTDEAALAQVHEGKTATDAMPKRLKETEVNASACKNDACHALDDAAMAELTAGYAGLVDSQGTQANPHEVMGLTEGHKDIVCADCHIMHGEPIAAEEMCITCHHAGVYECNTCH